MKKAKKLLALISSAVMIASIGAMSVSAGISGENTYIKYIYNYNDNIGCNIPIEIKDNLYYKGIVITMPEGIVPTPDLIEMECDISEYSEGINTIGMVDVESGKPGWIIEDTAKTRDNCYFLDVKELLNEDEAIDFAEKLVIKGISIKAEVLYEHHSSIGHIHWFDEQFVLTINLKKVTDAESFNVSNYQELANYDFVINDAVQSEGSSTVRAYCGLNFDDYNNNFIEFYEDVQKLREDLKENHDEIEDISLSFMHLASDQQQNFAGYQIIPIWGDATNDDKVDLYDAIEIAKYIMDIFEFDEDVKLLADINRDGVTDLYDAIEIARIIMEESKAE